jgi:hypothetical protein
MMSGSFMTRFPDKAAGLYRKPEYHAVNYKSTVPSGRRPCKSTLVGRPHVKEVGLDFTANGLNTGCNPPPNWITSWTTARTATSDPECHVDVAGPQDADGGIGLLRMNYPMLSTALHSNPRGHLQSESDIPDAFASALDTRSVVGEVRKGF